jgi:hypothetical protein
MTMQPEAKTNLLSADPPVRLQRGRDGRLHASRAGADTAVRPVRCFPWSNPGRFISLRDDKDREVAFVGDPGDLDEPSRAVLVEELAQAGFVLHVSRILEVREELEIRIWKVQTREGLRTFQTGRDEWPRPLPDGNLLLSDVAGDLYLVPRAADLDPTSRRVLWAFMD